MQTQFLSGTNLILVFMNYLQNKDRIKEDYLAKSNQVHSTIETRISNFRPTIAKTFFNCCTDLI